MIYLNHYEESVITMRRVSWRRRKKIALITWGLRFLTQKSRFPRSSGGQVGRSRKIKNHYRRTCITAVTSVLRSLFTGTNGQETGVRTRLGPGRGKGPRCGWPANTDVCHGDRLLRSMARGFSGIRMLEAEPRDTSRWCALVGPQRLTMHRRPSHTVASAGCIWGCTKHSHSTSTWTTQSKKRHGRCGRCSLSPPR